MSVFKCRESASQHGVTHTRKRSYICPGAKEYGCNRSLHSLTGALSHLKVVHRKVRYPCPLTGKYNYNDLFTSRSRARSHARSLYEKQRFPCPLAEQENCSTIFADKGILAPSTLVLLPIGLTCIGPTSCSGGICLEPCPQNIVLDLDTAFLSLSKKSGNPQTLIGLPLRSLFSLFCVDEGAS
jgi:hypothetical protein